MKVFVFGSSRGIGKCIADKLAQQNEVIAVSRSRSEYTDRIHWPVDMTELDELAHGFLGYYNKFSKDDDYAFVFSQRYRADENDQAMQRKLMVEAPKRLLDLIETDHLKSPMAVVFLTSQGVRFIADEQDVAYHMARAEIEQMTRYYAVKLGKHGTCVNAVSMDIVLKPENKQFYEQDENLLPILKKAALNRICDAESVSQTVEFLLQSKCITGQTVVLDAGAGLKTCRNQ